MERPEFTYSNETKVLDIIIKGQHVILKIGDCIQFDKTELIIPDDDDADVEAINVKTIGVITGFAYSSWDDPDYPNRIFYAEWIEAENTWDLHRRPSEHIGIYGTYLPNNEWKSIVKLDKCPGVAKGGKKSRNKKNRNNRLKISKHSKKTHHI